MEREWERKKEDTHTHTHTVKERERERERERESRKEYEREGEKNGREYTHAFFKGSAICLFRVRKSHIQQHEMVYTNFNWLTAWKVIDEDTSKAFHSYGNIHVFMHICII